MSGKNKKESCSTYNSSYYQKVLDGFDIDEFPPITQDILKSKVSCNTQVLSYYDSVFLDCVGFMDHWNLIHFISLWHLHSLAKQNILFFFFLS